MTQEEREALFIPILTAPTMDELKIRFTLAAKKAMAGNDAGALRILTAYKDARKAEMNNGY